MPHHPEPPIAVPLTGQLADAVIAAAAAAGLEPAQWIYDTLSHASLAPGVSTDADGVTAMSSISEADLDTLNDVPPGSRVLAHHIESTLVSLRVDGEEHLVVAIDISGTDSEGEEVRLQLLLAAVGVPLLISALNGCLNDAKDYTQ